MKKLMLVGLFLLSSAVAANAANYTPIGPQANIGVSDVLNGGWTIVYSETMNTPLGSDIATTLSQYSNDLIMLAGRQVGSDTFSVLAEASYADVFFNTNNSWDDNTTTHNANGSEWYYTPEFSWGFAPAGASVYLSSADTSNLNDPLRMSLHTLDWVGGWRIGTNTYLNDSQGWEKVILVLDQNNPVPEPGTIVLLGLGMAGLAFYAKRRQNKV